MTNKFENGLFIFRRDLRIVDNNGLNLLNEKCKNVFTIFIFTPEQVGSGNKYKSDNSVQFMIESLEDLASQISKSGGHLYTFYGHNDKIVAECKKAFDINVVCFNLDISPYAKERDEKIIKLCQWIKKQDWRELYKKTENIRRHNREHFFNKEALTLEVNKTVLGFLEFADRS